MLSQADLCLGEEGHENLCSTFLTPRWSLIAKQTATGRLCRTDDTADISDEGQSKRDGGGGCADACENRSLALDMTRVVFSAAT